MNKMTDTIKENILKEIEELNEQLNDDEEYVFRNCEVKVFEKEAQLKICDEYEKKIQEFVEELISGYKDTDCKCCKNWRKEIKKKYKEHFGLEENK